MRNRQFETVLLIAAGIAGCVLHTPVWAHEGHDHGAYAQRGREQGYRYPVNDAPQVLAQINTLIKTRDRG